MNDEKVVALHFRDFNRIVFTRTYVKDRWNMGSGESKSGLGSSMLYTQSFRKNLLDIIRRENIKKIFDCSSGDWNWMRTIEDKLPDYVGNDIVEALVNTNNEKFSNDRIKFICGDMIDSLEKYEDGYFDLIMCRHTLEHLITRYNVRALETIKRKTKFALITNSSQKENNELFDYDGFSSRGINLNQEPYLSILGEPVFVFYDSVGDEIICDKTSNCTTGYLYRF